MLKIVLLAYSRGLISSRKIEQACEQNVLFMAISGDSRPSFTHIARFVRELASEVQALFTQAHTLITANAGYHSDANIQALHERAIPALIADNCMRQRDTMAALLLGAKRRQAADQQMTGCLRAAFAPHGSALTRVKPSGSNFASSNTT